MWRAVMDNDYDDGNPTRKFTISKIMVFSLSLTGLIAQELISENIRHDSVRTY